MLLWTNIIVASLSGGPVNPLSLSHLHDKGSALLALAKHMVLHPVGPGHPSPEETLRRASRRHGVPDGFLVAVGRAESGLRPHRISRAGAMGMMQLMPATARQLGVEDPFDTEQSADGAARFIKQLWRRYRGDARRVAAAYNAGPGVVPRTGALDRLPRETRAYVARVVSSM